MSLDPLLVGRDIPNSMMGGYSESCSLNFGIAEISEWLLPRMVSDMKMFLCRMYAPAPITLIYCGTLG